MTVANPTTLIMMDDTEHFSHEEAVRLSRRAIAEPSRIIIVDLRRAAKATTSAFARLIVLRRALLRSGRDLRLSGLHDAVSGLYEVNRLQSVLPLA